VVYISGMPAAAAVVGATMGVSEVSHDMHNVGGAVPTAGVVLPSGVTRNIPAAGVDVSMLAVGDASGGTLNGVDGLPFGPNISSTRQRSGPGSLSMQGGRFGSGAKSSGFKLHLPDFPIAQVRLHISFDDKGSHS